MFVMPAKPTTSQAPKIDVSLLKPDSAPVAVQPMVQAPATPLVENMSQVQPSKDNTNYWLGALAVAASVVAGIYISKGKKAEEVVNEVPQQVQKKVDYPHIKDNLLKALGVNNVELEIGEIHEYDLMKKVTRTRADGTKVDDIKRHGIKRIEDHDGQAALRRTYFVNDDNVILLSAHRDLEGNVVDYVLKDVKGHILKEYDAAKGIHKKFVYNKDDVLVREVKYDCNGHSIEKRYNPVARDVDEEDKVMFGDNAEEYLD